nr:sugar diacid recognition domain-containing protein [Uruburuella testudinis]
MNETSAQSIVNRAMKIIGKSVNVMDERGVIIASGDPERLGQRHPGALLALSENRIVEIDNDLARQWHYEALPGINLPITYLGKPLGVVGISGIPAEVRPYAELVKMTAELIIEQEALLEKAHWKRRHQEEFLLAVIRGQADFTYVQRQAAFLDLDLSGHFTAVIIQCLNPEEFLLIHRLVAYLEQPQFKQLVVITALNEITVLKQSDPARPLSDKNLQLLLPESVRPDAFRMAAGGMFCGDDALYLAYKTARGTLDYALAHYPGQSCYFFHHYRLPVLLEAFSGTWQAKELLKPLQKLTAHKHGQMLQKTLRQYFLCNGDLPQAAAKLFVHPNTLRYRLAQIEQITGLSLSLTDTRFVLFLSTILDNNLEKHTKE